MNKIEALTVPRNTPSHIHHVAQTHSDSRAGPKTAPAHARVTLAETDGRR